MKRWEAAHADEDIDISEFISGLRLSFFSAPVGSVFCRMMARIEGDRPVHFSAILGIFKLVFTYYIVLEYYANVFRKVSLHLSSEFFQLSPQNLMQTF